ncbi:MAG: DivIVA domain-containing protein [Eggerthellaceae bacterium]
MGITVEEINNQSFSIERKGYDVDEVDVFLERVADGVAEMNAEIEQLKTQLEDARRNLELANQETAPAEDISQDATVAIPLTPAPETEETSFDSESAVATIDDRVLADKDARIAELERELQEKKADDSAIAQALIAAQRTADETINRSKREAAGIIKDAEDDAARIANKAEAERSRVLDAIKKLEDERDETRADYRDMLSNFIADATRKLGSIEESVVHSSLSNARAVANADDDNDKTGMIEPVAIEEESEEEIDVREQRSHEYTTPQPSGEETVVPATPKRSFVEKDLSGFGDAENDIDLDDID